jgi:hypothetical protein
MVLSIVALAALADPVADVPGEVERFFQSIPAANAVRPNVDFAEVCRDPRRRRATIPVAQPMSEADEKRIQELSEALDQAYPDGGMARLRDPRQKEIEAILSRFQNRPDVKAANDFQDRIERDRQTYDAATKRFVEAQGYRSIAGWKGQMALKWDRPVRDRSQARITYFIIVDFAPRNRFWHENAGRLVWTGSYTVRMASRFTGTPDSTDLRYALAPRQVVREGRNFMHLFVGQEGFLVKFTPLRSGDAPVPLPALGSYVFRLPQMGWLNFAGDPGEFVPLQGLPPVGDPPRHPLVMLTGFPVARGSKAQAGIIRSPGYQTDEITLAWRFAPVP